MIEPTIVSDQSGNAASIFENMCNFAPIMQLGDFDVALQHLIELCLLPTDKQFQNTQQLMKAIDDNFGLEIPEYQIKANLEKLIFTKRIEQTTSNALILSLEVRSQHLKFIKEASGLEHDVKEKWLRDISIASLDNELIWKVLQNYLTKAFWYYCIQAEELFDSTKTPSKGFVTLLDDTLSHLFLDRHQVDLQPEQQAALKIAIANFLATIRSNENGIDYTLQLRRSTCNCFSLAIRTDMAEQFRKKLNPIYLFFDANFLLSIFDSHVNSPFVKTSNELLQAIKKNQLPFQLFYHPLVMQEIQSEIDRSRNVLISRDWTLEMSENALSNSFGIERSYHEMNLRNLIDTDTFMKRYDNISIVLKGQGINLAQDDLQGNPEYLLSKYREYLKDNNAEKPDEVIANSVILLNTVQQLRAIPEPKRSGKIAGLLITWNHHLYRFNWQKDSIPYALSPSLFLKALQPFITPSSNFDRSFARIFALPEMRYLDINAHEIYDNRRRLPKQYTGIPIDSAPMLLSNTLLVDRLVKLKDDDLFLYAPTLEEKKVKDSKKGVIVQETTNFAPKEQLQRQQTGKLRQANQSAQEHGRENHGNTDALRKAELFADVYASITSILIVGYLIELFLFLNHMYNWIVNSGLQFGIALIILLLIPCLFAIIRSMQRQIRLSNRSLVIWTIVVAVVGILFAILIAIMVILATPATGGTGH